MWSVFRLWWSWRENSPTGDSFTFLGEKVLGIFARHCEFAWDTPQQLNDQCYMVYLVARGGRGDKQDRQQICQTKSQSGTRSGSVGVAQRSDWQHTNERWLEINQHHSNSQHQTFRQSASILVNTAKEIQKWPKFMSDGVICTDRNLPPPTPFPERAVDTGMAYLSWWSIPVSISRSEHSDEELGQATQSWERDGLEMRHIAGGRGWQEDRRDEQHVEQRWWQEHMYEQHGILPSQAQKVTPKLPTESLKNKDIVESSYRRAAAAGFVPAKHWNIPDMLQQSQVRTETSR